MKNKLSLKHLSIWKRAFLILALLFAVIGFGTLGSVQSVGKFYRLPKQRSGDGMEPSITFLLEEPGHGEEGHVHRDLYIKKIYVNVGTAYSEYGSSVTLRIGYGVSVSSKFYSFIDYPVENLYTSTTKEGGAVEKSTANTLYNWGTVEMNSSGYRLAVYPYWRLTAVYGDVIVNEVVFVANDADDSGEDVILNATVSTQLTNLAEEDSQVLSKAKTPIDRQKIPSLSQSSYFRFAPEEVAALSTYSELKLGNNYGTGNVNHMDRIYSPFGLDILFLGPSIFGLSPFGFRFMPMLASVGILIFSYLFVKKLTGSEKAAFFFSLLYALCGMSISLAHLGTPLMIGLFFFMASLYFCYGFFTDGMRAAKLSSSVPVILTAFFAAASVCTNGAFLIPVLGICGLFAAGVVRQRKRLYSVISDEADAVLEEEKTETAEGENAPDETGRKRIAKLVTDANYIRTVSTVLFTVILVLGFFLISILALLPLYQTYIKVLDDPANPQKGIFYFLFTAFAGGFSGDNGVANLSSPFSFVYVLFNGTGTVHALTAGGILVSIAGMLLGLIGLIFMLVRVCRDKSPYKTEFVLLLIGFVLSLVTAFFAKGGLAFLLLADLFLFAFAALSLGEGVTEEGAGKKQRIAIVLGTVLAAICFALFAVFTFSIPLPEGIVGILVK